MTSRRVPLILALAALVAGAGWVWKHAPQPAADVLAITAKSPIGSADVRFANATIESAALDNNARPTMAPPVSLQGHTAALLAEQVTLQQLDGAAEVPLSPEQWSAFAAISSHHQAVRQAFEATIANVAAVEDGRVRLEIPLYANAGDALRAAFYADLRETLGAAATEAIMRAMGPALEGHFAGFGVGVQTLEFVADPRGVDTDYQVTRTVKYWNSLAAGSELTTRRETHFPGLEDPAGHHWGPFLAVVAVRGPAKS